MHGESVHVDEELAGARVGLHDECLKVTKLASIDDACAKIELARLQGSFCPPFRYTARWKCASLMRPT
jgi:hypothetical protein